MVSLETVVLNVVDLCLGQKVVSAVSFGYPRVQGQCHIDGKPQWVNLKPHAHHGTWGVQQHPYNKPQQVEVLTVTKLAV